MGLMTFIITVLGGAVVFLLPSYFLLLEAQKVGFPLDNTLAGVIVVVVSVALVLLWPLAWFLRFIYYKVRKKDMPPVRPPIEIPRWMSVSVKFFVTTFTLMSVLTLFSVAFLRIATIGYTPVVDAASGVGISCQLGVLKLIHLSQDALPLRDIEVISGIDATWSIQAQDEELWVVSTYLLDYPLWIQPFTDKFGLKPVARLGTLSSMVDVGMSVQPVLALGDETVTEYLLLLAAKYLPFFSFKEIKSKSVTLDKTGQEVSIRLSGGLVLLGDSVDSSQDSSVGADTGVSSVSGSDVTTTSVSTLDNSIMSVTDSDSTTSGATVDTADSEDDSGFGDDF